MKMPCITCSDMHEEGKDAVRVDVRGEYIQCAWCYHSEWGHWPTGMTMDDDPPPERLKGEGR